MKKKLALLAGIVIGSMTTATEYQAATIVYTNKSTFLSNVQAGYYLETFSSLSSDSTLTEPLSFSQKSFSYSISTGDGGGLSNVLLPHSKYFLTPYSSTILNFSFTGGNVTAFSGDFLSNDYLGNIVFDMLTLTLNDGTVKTLSTSSGATAFIGFTSSVPITSLSVTIANINNYPGVENFLVGTATVSEPVTILGVLTGLGLGASLKRKLKYTKPEFRKTTSNL